MKPYLVGSDAFTSSLGSPRVESKLSWSDLVQTATFAANAYRTFRRFLGSQNKTVSIELEVVHRISSSGMNSDLPSSLLASATGTKTICFFMLNLILDLSRCLPVFRISVYFWQTQPDRLLFLVGTNWPWTSLIATQISVCPPYYQKQLMLKRYNESRKNREAAST